MITFKYKYRFNLYMEGRQINIRINETLLKRSKKMLESGSYESLQEFFKEKLREEIKKHEETQTIIKRLEKLKGSVKPKPRLTREERDKLAMAMTEKKSREMTKKYGLEDVTIN